MTQEFNTATRKIEFFKEKKRSASQAKRKAETKTKIQLGGLLIKSEITDLFSIFPGVDLQMDEEEREKATLLLGALIDMCRTITPLSSSQKEEWEILGQSAFINHFLREKKG